MRLNNCASFKKFGLYFAGLALVALCAQVVFSQGSAGRVMLDLTGGKAYVNSTTPGLKDPNGVIKQVWVSVSFMDPAKAHSVVAIVIKDGRSTEVTLNLQGRYARGSTSSFNGMPVKGAWQVRIKGETLDGVGIFMTIDVNRGRGGMVPTPIPTPVPTPTPTPTPTPRPTPGLDLGVTITPEIQFQALTRLLIKKGVITAPELAKEIQRVARDR